MMSYQTSESCEASESRQTRQKLRFMMLFSCWHCQKPEPEDAFKSSLVTNIGQEANADDVVAVDVYQDVFVGNHVGSVLAYGGVPERQFCPIDTKKTTFHCKTLVAHGQGYKNPTLQHPQGAMKLLYTWGCQLLLGNRAGVERRGGSDSWKSACEVS